VASLQHPMRGARGTVAAPALRDAPSRRLEVAEGIRQCARRVEMRTTRKRCSYAA
jgi:hypothetical protein